MNPWALAALTGLLQILVFAPASASPLAWVAFVPLLLALRSAGTVYRKLSLAAFSGMVANVGQLNWIAHTMNHYTGVPPVVGWAATLLVASMVTSFWVIWVWLSEMLSSRYRISSYLSFPAVWVLTELLRLYVLQFPWNFVGYALVPASLLRQSADLFGVYGLSFVIVWINVVIASAVPDGNLPEDTAATRRQLWMAAGAVMAMLVYGEIRLLSLRSPESSGQPLHLLLVQGNIPQTMRWNPEYTETTVEKYLNLTRDALSSGLASGPTGVVFWPESAMPFPLYSHPEYRERLSGFATETGMPLITGALHSEPLPDGTNQWFNSLFVFEPGDRLGPAARYDKVELVPYGEYVPFRFLVPVLKLFEGNATEGFTAGRDPKPLSAGSWRFAPLICYEGLFPLHVRGLVNRGAQFLLNGTNDAWFGPTSAPEQLLNMSSLRAVETRHYLFRVANTGLTAGVDPSGEIVDRTKLDIDATRLFSAPLPTTANSSFYLMWGDWPLRAGLLLLAGVCLSRELQRKKTRP